MVDPGRRKYYRLPSRRRHNRGRAEGEELATRLARMSREDLVRWVEHQLAVAPASEMYALLVSCVPTAAAAAA